MKMLPTVFFFIGFLASWSSIARCENNTFDEYRLVSLIPTTKEHLEALRNFEDPDGEVEVLKRSRDFLDPFDVLVPPHKASLVTDFSEIYGVNYHVRDLDYGRRLETVERSSRRRTDYFNPYSYNSYNAINEYLDSLQIKAENLVKIQRLGKSYQGRDLKLVRISSDPAAGNPAIFVDAGIHAREWVAPAMALYLIHRLTHHENGQYPMLDGVDWYILPLVNPDGYEFTRESASNRMWRKTRSKNSKCFGVDGNRNYGFHWGVSGVSSNPCDRETYAGPKPFSEPETAIVRNVMMENADRIKLYVSLHAYGQYLVYPWGYTGDFLPKEWRKLDSMARIVSDAVVLAGGKPFKVMSAGKWYPAAGGSDDFAFGSVGIPYSYTMELTDGYEFQFPERNLRTVLPQFYEGFRAFGRQIRKEFSAKYVRQGRNDGNATIDTD